MTSKQLAWLIRRHCVEMTHLSGGSHIGSMMSVADIIAVLYANVMKYDIKKPDDDLRDRFILSKGHASAAVYAALAECGFFDKEELKTYYGNGSRLSGHISNHIPGIDFSTGSLGHGLCTGAGMAYAAKKDGRNHRVYVVMGDGECDEGSVWEAALFAAHFRLNNMTVVIDRNHMQSMDFQENTIEMGDFGAKWRAFGWKVIEINGNDHEQIRNALVQSADEKENPSHKPVMIIADTVKGYGVSFMQNDILWHYRFPHDGWEYDTAVTELHMHKPAGVTDPYTPDGIVSPMFPGEDDDIGKDHTFSSTWKTAYPEKMRREEAKSGSGEKVHKI